MERYTRLWVTRQYGYDTSDEGLTDKMCTEFKQFNRRKQITQVKRWDQTLFKIREATG